MRSDLTRLTVRPLSVCTTGGIRILCGKQQNLYYSLTSVRRFFNARVTDQKPCGFISAGLLYALKNIFRTKFYIRFASTSALGF